MVEGNPRTNSVNPLCELTGTLCNFIEILRNPRNQLLHMDRNKPKKA